MYGVLAADKIYIHTNVPAPYRQCVASLLNKQKRPIIVNLLHLFIKESQLNLFGKK